MRGHDIVSRRRSMSALICFTLLCAITFIRAPAWASPIYQVATFSNTEQFYPDLSLYFSQFTTPPGRFTDLSGNIDVPLVQYAPVTTSRLAQGWPIVTTTLQSVVVQDNLILPANGPLITLLPGLSPYDATTYRAFNYSGSAAPGTVLYSNAPPPPPPPPPTCASIIQSAVHPTTGGVLSLSGQPTTISASFVPNFGYSVTQAATACGVDTFAWQQTITNLPSPSPIWAALDPCVRANPGSYQSVCPSMKTPNAFLDPVLGGYTYCYNDPDEPCNNDYPFYHRPDPQLGFVAFDDTPADPCLPGFSLARLASACKSEDPPGSFVGFTTTLVGAKYGSPNPVLMSLPLAPGDDSFTWTDTYNGAVDYGITGTGGISCGGCALNNSRYAAVPGSGSGGITLISVNGVDVPEPSTLILLGAVLFGLGFVRRFAALR